MAGSSVCQGAGDPQPPGALGRGDVAGQGELVADPAPDRPRIPQQLVLLGGDLGAAEPHREGGLGGRGGGLDAFQQGDGVDPGGVDYLVVFGVVGGGRVGQLPEPGQHLGQFGGGVHARNAIGGHRQNRGLRDRYRKSSLQL